MKVLEIVENRVARDYSSDYGSVEEAYRYFSTDIEFVEAPDFVFPGWGYDRAQKGDARFLKPSVGVGLAYDDATGSVWNPEEVQSMERTRLHAETTNDTLQALRKIREGDTTIDWEAWLRALDDYNVAIEETRNQPGYPLKVEYPEYPKKPTA